jgi:hypothetical protein
VIEPCPTTKIFLLKRLLVVIFDGGDDFNKKIEGGLNSFLVILYKFCNFIEEEFEVIFRVEVLDSQADDMVKQCQFILGNGSISIAPF